MDLKFLENLLRFIGAEIHYVNLTQAAQMAFGKSLLKLNAEDLEQLQKSLNKEIWHMYHVLTPELLANPGSKEAPPSGTPPVLQ